MHIIRLTISGDWYISGHETTHVVPIETNYPLSTINEAYKESVKQYDISLHHNCDGNCFNLEFINRFKNAIKNVDSAYYDYVEYILKRDHKWCCQEPPQLAHVYMLIANITLKDLRWHVLNQDEPPVQHRVGHLVHDSISI